MGPQTFGNTLFYIRKTHDRANFLSFEYLTFYNFKMNCTYEN